MPYYDARQDGDRSSITWQELNLEVAERAVADLLSRAPAGSYLRAKVKRDAPAGDDRVLVWTEAKMPLGELRSLVENLPLPGQDYEPKDRSIL